FAESNEIRSRTEILEDVGLGYLALGQSTQTLSGGEAQRLKLAGEIAKGSQEQCVFLFDEPTTGLHLSDVEHLLGALHRLVDQGKTVIAIEHHLPFISQADYVIDLGPEGGNEGGRLVCAGTPEEVSRSLNSYTGAYLRESFVPLGPGKN